MSSYGGRGRYRWGADDWKDFYWLCRIIFWTLAAIMTVIVVWQIRHPSFCEIFGTHWVIERINGRETLVEKTACVRWRE